MKVLVAYAGKTGVTKKCVDYLKEISKEDITLCYAKSQGKIDLSLYDTIIVGGAIRAGKIHSSIKKFYKANNFSGKKLGLFIVCGSPENFEKYLEANFPDNKADATACFGGEFNLEKANGILDRIIIAQALKALKKKNRPLPEIDYEAIKEFNNKLFDVKE